MKTKNKITAILSVFGGAAIIMIALACVIFSGIRKDSKDLISARNNTVALGLQLSETENFGNKYEDYRRNLDAMRSIFIDSDNPVNFIKFIEDSASDSGMASQVYLPSSSQTSNQNYSSFSFSGSGALEDALIFIKKVEFGPYLLEMQNLSIGSSKSNSKIPSSDVDLSFTLKVFIK